MSKPLTSLADLSFEALMCRDIKHKWDWTHDYSIEARLTGKKVTKYIVRLLVCERCECERADIFVAPSFDKVAVRRTYQPGYLLQGYDTRPHITEIRREIFNRLGFKD